MLTTNRPFGQWRTIFDEDNTLATALVDRLMHHGEAIVIRGRPYGEDDWVRQMVKDLGLEQTVRSEGRPRKASQPVTDPTS